MVVNEVDFFDWKFLSELDKDDELLEWDEFHKKHPKIAKENYDLLVKDSQEM